MSAPKLTLEGQVITDALRAQALRGDGLIADSSFGIWEATTNIALNGGAETNLAGVEIVPAAGDTLVERSSERPKFGKYSFKTTLVENYGGTPIWNYGWWHTYSTISGATAGRVFTGSMFVWLPAGRYWINPYLHEFGGAQPEDNLPNEPFFEVIYPMDGWHRYWHTGPIVQNDRTSIQMGLYIEQTDAASNVIYIDGRQLEEKPYPTPYVPTDGATASRDNSVVRAPGSLLDRSQGWAAMRLRMGWAKPTTRPMQIFEWSTTPDYLNYYALWWGVVDQQFKFETGSGADGPILSGPNQVIPIGSEHTVIVAWTPTAIKMSVNGAPFVQAAISASPIGLDDETIQFGASTVPAYSIGFDGDFLWAALGKGIITDAEVAYLNSLGNNDPNFNALKSAGVSAILPFADDTYHVPQVHSHRSPRIVNTTGPVEPGALLVLDQGEWDGFPAPEIRITWERAKLANFNDVLEIAGEHGTTYRVAPWDRGYYIRAKVGAA